jgi:anti-sigma regulatory factor (Ser/Thr protein kinase)
MATVCDQWGVPDPATDRLKLIVSELAGNVVRHARTPMEIVLRRSHNHIHVEVHDDDPHPARLQPPETLHAADGRGLMLVGASATAWGCTPTSAGKKTWATVRCVSFSRR